MKVLVTGASGFIGRHVLTVLQAHGVDAVILGRHAPAGFEAVPLIAIDLLRTSDFLPAMQKAGASHLLHLAWTTDHGAYWTSPLNFEWVQATLQLVRAFGECGGKRVVATGSCAEYDWTYGYLREDATPHRPSTPYGTAKRATHDLLQAMCASNGLTFAWAKVFLPFGPGDSPARMIPSLVSVFRGSLPAFGVNANAFRDFIYITDVAKALFFLLNDTGHGGYNICSGEPVQIAHVVRTLAQLVGADAQLVLSLASQRQGEPRMLVGENSKLLDTGWHADWTLERGLEAFVQAYPTKKTT